MTDSKPYTIRWGILATGGIAQKFTKDLVLDPSTRSVSDVSHTVVAAASRSQERAQEFLTSCGCPSTAKAYGDYASLAADPDVDIVYVATPHSHHYQNARLCLEAGKHVLCEKALTVNAAQARKLVEIARERKVFLMEAQWTRYFPLAVELRKMVSEGKIGTVHRVFADLSIGDSGTPEAKWGVENRMVNVDLAGGAMLDLGIYSILWVFQFLYHIQPPQHRLPPNVVSQLTKYPNTGADELTSLIMSFPPLNSHGIATTGLRVSFDPDNKGTAGPAVRIQGTKGEIQVFGPIFRPTRFRVIPLEGFTSVEFADETREIPGQGMFWEADECARCLRDGKLESETLPLEESLVMMDVMDQVRQQNGLVYPEKIETLEYPLPGF
ncbi:NADP:D-xylose dehydrogenase [Eremomyces bilateralis CBS 781.70]|uniref:D-xylose 1-dehydrogenase (NADP(+), D-xylono-1,5-lactone-forming) n=1 Tax=Eremomyces bilateralis CBS 781.70 TaxID=1392243 RepID=A0A6G1FZ28_9PEZI|nr:NADP:D-xylose dehydrogenase [Eremomyces bilateralis CBS 781.70]KAF1811044.1 NADP:D-xylose dehydrogenase [Eremomyces bilateralis CBS 781.70]